MMGAAVSMLVCVAFAAGIAAESEGLISLAGGLAVGWALRGFA